MSEISSTPVGLLGELALAAAAATHRRGLAVALGTVLQREVGVTGLQIVLPTVDGWSAISWRSGGAPVEAPAPPPGAHGDAPKVRKMSGQWSASVPIRFQSGPAGLLRLDFGDDEIPPIALEAEVVLVVGRIVGMACHSCDLLTKVARLSRRAYQQNRHLRRRMSERSSETPIVAGSAATQSVLAQCELAAPRAVSVLVRLENLLERALILHPEGELSLPAPTLGLRPARSRQSAAKAPPTLDDAIRSAIEAALTTTRGKLYGADGAAALLRLKPSTLQAKMGKLHIDRNAFT